MPNEIPSLRNVLGGIVQDVDSSVVPSSSLAFSVNFKYNKIIGRAVLREGTTIIGSQIVNGKSILGLTQYIKKDGTKVLLAAVNDSTSANADIFKYDGSWAKTSEDWTATQKIRFVQFLDTITAFNGTDGARSFDGSSWVSSGGPHDVGNFPIGKYAVEWKDRIYSAGVSANLDRLYYSGTPTTGTVSWTSGNGYIDIEAEEGAGSITALAKIPRYLLIFKERSLKRWDGYSTYPESLNSIGTTSQESVILGRETVMYFNSNGIYETNGVQSVKISRAIQKIIDAIPSANYADICGFSNGDMCRWSIGDGIIIDDITYNNVEIQFNLDDKSWQVMSYPYGFKFYTKYIDGTAIKIVGGDENGNVKEIDSSATNDDGDSIAYLLQTHPLEFGSRGRIKDISNVVSYTKKMGGGILSCRTDEIGEFEPLGNISKDTEEIKKNVSGGTFEYKIIGEAKGGGVEFIGLDFDRISISENYSK